MTTPFMRFPNVERVLATDLETLTAPGRTGNQTPANLQDLLPFIRVVRIGGPSTRVNDHARVDIDVWAALYDEAERLAERIRQRLVGPPPAVRLFDRVQCDIGPRELPWGDDQAGVRRFGAQYSITSRRRLL